MSGWSTPPSTPRPSVGQPRPSSTGSTLAMVYAGIAILAVLGALVIGIHQAMARRRAESDTVAAQEDAKQRTLQAERIEQDLKRAIDARKAAEDRLASNALGMKEQLDALREENEQLREEASKEEQRDIGQALFSTDEYKQFVRGHMRGEDAAVLDGSTVLQDPPYVQVTGLTAPAGPEVAAVLARTLAQGQIKTSPTGANATLTCTILSGGQSPKLALMLLQLRVPMVDASGSFVTWTTVRFKTDAFMISDPAKEGAEVLKRVELVVEPFLRSAFGTAANAPNAPGPGTTPTPGAPPNPGSGTAPTPAPGGPSYPPPTPPPAPPKK